MKRGTATVSADELREAIRPRTPERRPRVRIVPMGEVVTREAELAALRRRGSRAPGRTHRVRQRLLRPAARRARALPARARPPRPTASSSRSTTTSRWAAEGAGPAGPAGGRPRGAGRGAARRGLRHHLPRRRPSRALLELLKPDVHCKGTDYTVDTVPERDTVRALRRPHRHRRRPEGPLDARTAGRISAERTRRAPSRSRSREDPDRPPRRARRHRARAAGRGGAARALSRPRGSTGSWTRSTRALLDLVAASIDRS